MKTKKTAVLIAAIIAVSLILVAPANAATFPQLPPGPVTVTLTEGPTHWPGTVALSDVPAGDYDVANSPPSYTAWCSQLFNFISYGPSYPATLISSLDLPTPWDKINYLLNHNTGKDLDVQLAMWLLLGFTPAELVSRGYSVTPDAQGMYDDANLNGAGFAPSPGDLVAVKCETEGNVQDLIFELTVPGLPPGLSPGFWKHNINVALGGRGSFSSPHEGEPHLTALDLQGWADEIGVTLEDALEALNARGPGSADIRLDMANAFNEAAGFAEYMDED